MKLLSLLFLALSVPSAIAENLASKAETTSPDRDVSYIRLSAELASVARDARDPLLMLAAAVLEEMALIEEEPREKSASEQETRVDEKSGADSLFALAEEYSGTNEVLLVLVADAMERDYTLKGRRPPVRDEGFLVPARDTDVHRREFPGRRLAEVAAIGDGDTDPDLYVYDENGSLVCSDTDYTDRMYCSWTPRWTGPFDIEIENLGDVYNEYRLVTN